MILCKTGLIANLARPESNVTGFTNVTAELAGKRLELLKEAFPKIYRLAIFGAVSPARPAFREIETPARALRIQLQRLEMKEPGEFGECLPNQGQRYRWSHRSGRCLAQ